MIRLGNLESNFFNSLLKLTMMTKKFLKKKDSLNFQIFLLKIFENPDKLW